MTDGEPSLVDSLPNRPLTVAEGEHLEDQETASFWIRPESIMQLGDEQVVVAMLAINRKSERVWLIGYDPNEEAWSVIEEWGYEELEQDAFYARLEDWEAETFIDS